MEIQRSGVLPNLTNETKTSKISKSVVAKSFFCVAGVKQICVNVENHFKLKDSLFRMPDSGESS